MKIMMRRLSEEEEEEREGEDEDDDDRMLDHRCSICIHFWHVHRNSWGNYRGLQCKSQHLKLFELNRIWSNLHVDAKVRLLARSSRSLLMTSTQYMRRQVSLRRKYVSKEPPIALPCSRKERSKSEKMKRNALAAPLAAQRMRWKRGGEHKRRKLHPNGRTFERCLPNFKWLALGGGRSVRSRLHRRIF